MNYKTTLLMTAIAAAAIAALGSAFPMVGTAFASNGPPNGEENGGGDTNTVNNCQETGILTDCRSQGFQVGSGNTQGDLTFED
jgi:hypothetical protein